MAPPRRCGGRTRKPFVAPAAAVARAPRTARRCLSLGGRSQGPSARPREIPEEVIRRSARSGWEVVRSDPPDGRCTEAAQRSHIARVCVTSRGRRWVPRCHRLHQKRGRAGGYRDTAHARTRAPTARRCTATAQQGLGAASGGDHLPRPRGAHGTHGAPLPTPTLRARAIRLRGRPVPSAPTGPGPVWTRRRPGASGTCREGPLLLRLRAAAGTKEPPAVRRTRGDVRPAARE
jgi:hypothetical protein